MSRQLHQLQKLKEAWNAIEYEIKRDDVASAKVFNIEKILMGDLPEGKDTDEIS